VIWDEDVDIAVNDPVNVDFHLNGEGAHVGHANLSAQQIGGCDRELLGLSRWVQQHVRQGRAGDTVA
jgi:hypothetical protein